MKSQDWRQGLTRVSDQARPAAPRTADLDHPPGETGLGCLIQGLIPTSSHRFRPCTAPKAQATPVQKTPSACSWRVTVATAPWSVQALDSFALVGWNKAVVLGPKLGVSSQVPRGAALVLALGACLPNLESHGSGNGVGNRRLQEFYSRFLLDSRTADRQGHRGSWVRAEYGSKYQLE